MAMAADIQLAGADDVISFHFDIPVEYLVWALRAGFFLFPALAYFLTWRTCLALQRSDRRVLRRGRVTGVAIASVDGAGPRSPELKAYLPISEPADEESQAVLQTRRPDELLMPVPRHLVPLPTPRRTVAQIRARLSQLYITSRLEPPHSTASANGTGDEGTANTADGTDHS